MSASIQIKSIHKGFGQKKALDTVSLEIPAGQVFGFLGPNGAGKTTTIRCLMDFIRPDAGTITIFGHDAHRDSAALKSQIGYLSSDLQLHPNWSAKTHIDFLGSIKGTERAAELTALLDLDIHKTVRALSSGNKQKLAIILAFMGSPKLLVMDEPTRALDPLLQNQLYQLVRDFAQQGGTVFFSSHNLPEVQALCDEVAIIKAGRIVATQTMADILKLSVSTIKATASSPFKPSDFKLKEVEVLSHTGKSITLTVAGHIDPVIKTLAKYTLTDIEVMPASLEDIFMKYYA